MPKRRVRKQTSRKNSNALLEGGIIAAILGIAAGIFLLSKPGKKFRKDVKQSAADFYKHLSPQLKKMKKMSEAEYKTFVKKALKKYSSTRKLSQKEQQAIWNEAKKSWQHFRKHLK